MTWEDTNEGTKSCTKYLENKINNEIKSKLYKIYSEHSEIKLMFSGTSSSLWPPSSNLICWLKQKQCRVGDGESPWWQPSYKCSKKYCWASPVYGDHQPGNHGQWPSEFGYSFLSKSVWYSRCYAVLPVPISYSLWEHVFICTLYFRVNVGVYSIKWNTFHWFL